MEATFKTTLEAISWLQEQTSLGNEIPEITIRSQWGEPIKFIGLDAVMATLCEKDARTVLGPELLFLEREAVHRFNGRLMATPHRCLQIVQHLVKEGRLVDQFKARLADLAPMLQHNIAPIRIDSIAGALDWVRTQGRRGDSPIELAELVQANQPYNLFYLDSILQIFFQREVSVRAVLGEDNVLALAALKRLNFHLRDDADKYHPMAHAFDCMAIILRFVKGCPLVEQFKAKFTDELRNTMLASFH